MTDSVRKIKRTAVKYLALFFCAVFLFFSFPFTPGEATEAPSLYVNDNVFYDWNGTPPETVNGIVYIPINMFIDLDAVYYYSNPGAGTFYLQNEITEEYLSFSLKTNDAYNGKGMVKIDIQVFHDSMYLPAIETANHLGLYIEMNSDGTVVRLSDATAKMSFSKLIALYSPVIEVPPTPPVTTDPPEVTDKPPVTDNPGPSVENPNDNPVTKPPEPTIIPCDVYICFTDPEDDNLDELIVALKSRNLPATFFLSEEYIKSSPQNVLKLYSNGYSLGIYIKNSFSDSSELLNTLETVNGHLRKITKQKTRTVAFSNNKDSFYEYLAQNGYTVNTFNITLPKSSVSSKNIISSVTSALYGKSEAKILMKSDVYSVTALYEIGKFINSYSIIKAYTIDETV